MTLRHFEVQARAASKLGVEPSQILSMWVTEARKELGLPVPSIWDNATINWGQSRCPERYKAVIIGLLQGEDEE